MPLKPGVRILHTVEHDGVDYEIDTEDPAAMDIKPHDQRNIAKLFSALGSNLREFTMAGNPSKYNISRKGFRDGTLVEPKRSR